MKTKRQPSHFRLNRRRLLFVFLVTICLPSTYLFEQDFVYFARLLLWTSRIILYFVLVRETRRTLLAITDKTRPHNPPYRNELIYVGILATTMLCTLAASADLIYMRNKLHYYTHRQEFAAVLEVAKIQVVIDAIRITLVT